MQIAIELPKAQGGFDDIYLNGCEDVDLCFKLRAARKASLEYPLDTL